MLTISRNLTRSALAATLWLCACGLDTTDPNSPNEADIITSAAGLREVAIGLQAEYGNELVDPVYIAELTTDGLGAIPQAFESYRLVDAGQPIDNDLGPSTETWAGMYDVITVANVLLNNVGSVPALDAGTASGIIALAKLFKGMAFGNLLNVYERIPLETGLQNLHPTFVTRQQALAATLALLNEARQQLITTPASATFNTTVLAPGFDLPNTIDAMIARFSLIAGDFTAANAAASRVNLSVLSEFRFSATDPNPLWTMFLNSGNSVAMRPEDRFRTDAQSGDQRVAHWVVAAAITGAAAPLDNFARYSLRDHSFPAYFPDEMRLIRAEVAARQNDLVTALTLVNQVRTPCSSTLNEPVACLPALVTVPTQALVLDAILKEREYELYLQGLRWSDLRRFGKPMKYRFMMVSRPECERNDNAPTEVCQLRTMPGT